LYGDIVSKLKSVSPQPIKYLLNTHQHYDHTGSNAQFVATTEILMHRNARANMISGVEVQMRYMGRGHTHGDSVIYRLEQARTVSFATIRIVREGRDSNCETGFEVR
jgi:glyoxylase-like metal-dependent hydrolase (beta-lactamase superfamily II)